VQWLIWRPDDTPRKDNCTADAVSQEQHNNDN
jgi:hypothetical protein